MRRRLAVANDLALFMALSGQQDDIVRARLSGGGGDGVAATANLLRTRRARHYGGADGRGIF